MASEGDSKLPKTKRRSLLPGIQKSTISKPDPPAPTVKSEPIKKLGIGERVSISGVKLGILKYYGEIPLASGVWCGIELDDPDGKHDGEVDGRRYFTCRPLHGIFAPIEKVDSVESVQLYTEKEIQLVSKDVPEEHPQLVEQSNLKEPIQQDFGNKIQFEEQTVPKKRCLPQLSSKSVISSRLPSAVASSKNEQKLLVTKIDDPQTEVLSGSLQRSQISKISSFSYSSAIKPKLQTAVESQDVVTKSKQELVETDSSSTDSTRSETVRKIPKPSILPGASRLPKYGKSESSPLLKAIKTVKSDVGGQANQSTPSTTNADKDLNTTFLVSNDESSGEDNFSDGVKLQLRADSRQYLNLTFDAENGLSSCNLPDVVSSASGSPSPSTETRRHSEQYEVFAYDQNSSQGLVDSAIFNRTDVLDDVTVKQLRDMDYPPVNKLTPSQASKLVSSYPGELITSTPLAQEKVGWNTELSESVRQRHGSGGSRLPILPNPGIRELFSKLPGAAMHGSSQNCSKIEVDSAMFNSDADNSVENYLYKSNDNVSGSKDDQPFELEDDSVLVDENVNVEAGATEDAEKTFVVKKGITEIDLPVDMMELVENLQKEEIMEEFLGAMTESFVQNLEQGLEKPNTKGMTDSGISDRSMTESTIYEKLNIESSMLAKPTADMTVCQNTTAIAGNSTISTLAITNLEQKVPQAENSKSMTDSGIAKSMTESGLLDFKQADKLMSDSDILQVVKPEKKTMIDSGISDGSMSCSQQIEFDEHRLEVDLRAGHVKQDRPVSLISTTSADTGYFPDTDSEIGTLTTNSPSDWMEKQGLRTSVSDMKTEYVKRFDEVEKDEGLKSVYCVESETDSDMCSDAGTLQDTDTETEEEEDRDEVDTACVTEYEISGIDLLEDSINPNKTIVISQVCPNAEEADSSVQGLERTENVNFVKSSCLQGETENSSESTTPTTVSNGVSISSGNESVIEREIVPISSHNEADSSQSEHVEKDNKFNNSKNLGYLEVVHDSSKESRRSENKKSSTLKRKTMEKVEHKKINVSKVRSSLADYIKSPAPVKHNEEKENEAKDKKNVMNKKWTDNKKVTGKSSERSSVSGNEVDKKDGGSESKHNRIIIEKEIPKIKKSTPKSKWGNIMSKIEASKEVPYKPKPKSEIKSKLDIFNVSNTPSPNVLKKEREPKKELKPRSKLVQMPKPDFSKIKSKLNITAPVNGKRDISPGADIKRTNSPKPHKNHSNGNVDLSESLNSTVSSTRTSHTDLSGNVSDSYSVSPRRSKSRTPRNSFSRISNLKSENPSSVASSHSDISQVSVKAQNEKNIKKSEMPRADKSKSNDAKTLMPAPKPRKSLTKSLEKKHLVAIKIDAPKKEVQKTLNSKPSPNQNRNRTVRSTKSNYLKSSQQPDLVSNSLETSASQISRLESLCESRTKELNYIKMQLKSNTQAFDAMSCLVRYLTEELDAFSCPQLCEKLKNVEKELTDAKSHIDDVELQRQKLEQDISDVKKRHQEELQSQKETLETQHFDTLKQVQARHDQVITCIKECHSENVSDQRLDHQRALDSLRLSHLEEIETLRTKHDNQMEELHKQHRNKVDDMTSRFESIKLALGEKVEMMKTECDENRRRAKASEEALLRDSDVRIQLALQPYQNLPKEIESLKTVIEMRNEEIQKLRCKNIELEKHLEELPIAQERLASYQQKVENLEAIVDIKSDHERQLHGKCQNLMKKYDKESKTNKRLSMDYEELMWKMGQDNTGSTENLYHRQISRSPPASGNSSPDPTKKAMSPIASDAEQTPRRARRSCGDEYEQRLKRRSGTFIVVPKRSSPSSIPQPKRLSPNRLESSSPKQSGASSSDTCSLSVSATELSSQNTSFQSVSGTEISSSDTSALSVSCEILPTDLPQMSVSQTSAEDAVFEESENIATVNNVSLNICVALSDDAESKAIEVESSLPDDDGGPSPLHDGGPSPLHDGGPSLLHDGGPSLLQIGPSLTHDGGPSLLHDGGPSLLQIGPSLTHDGGPSLLHDGGASLLQIGPSLTHDGGPSLHDEGRLLTDDGGPSLAHDREPSLTHDRGPSPPNEGELSSTNEVSSVPAPHDGLQSALNVEASPPCDGKAIHLKDGGKSSKHRTVQESDV